MGSLRKAASEKSAPANPPELAAESAVRTKRRAPADPFRIPGPENTNLAFLATPDAMLIHAFEHYDARRRLRHAVVYDFMTGEDSPESWEALVEAASREFKPDPKMLPFEALREPATINGIVDYRPISDTAPELYDRERRAVMKVNGQLPWVVMMTLNGDRHGAESFMHWVDSHLIPEVRRAARELTRAHFHGAAEGALQRRPGIRPTQARGGAETGPLSEKRLRRRLFALACHLIRRSAAPGETMTATLARYHRALPAGVSDEVNLDGFIKRVNAVNAAAEAEWTARLGSARLRAAIEGGRLRFD